MTMRPPDAWRKAVNCTRLAEKAADEMARKTLTIIRDSWIAIANESEVVGITDPEAILLILDRSMAAGSEAIEPTLPLSR
jgi:hypothetical protein